MVFPVSSYLANVKLEWRMWKTVATNSLTISPFFFPFFFFSILLLVSWRCWLFPFGTQVFVLENDGTGTSIQFVSWIWNQPSASRACILRYLKMALGANQLEPRRSFVRPRTAENAGQRRHLYSSVHVLRTAGMIHPS